MEDPEGLDERDELPPFELTMVERDAVHVISVHGDLDLATTPQLLELLKTVPDGSTVRLDLAAVPFVDSSGLKALLTAQQRFGDGLTLPNTPEHIVNLLTLVGIKKLMHLEP